MSSFRTNCEQKGVVRDVMTGVNCLKLRGEHRTTEAPRYVVLNLRFLLNFTLLHGIFGARDILKDVPLAANISRLFWRR